MIIYNRRFLSLFCLATLFLYLSFYLEFSWELKPCKLCQIQRYFLIAIAIICSFGFLSKWKKISNFALILSFLFLLIVSSYHTAIIIGWINDPCQVPKNFGNIDEYFQLLKNYIPCSTTALKILYIPIPLYNVFLSLGALWVIIFKKKKGLSLKTLFK